MLRLTPEELSGSVIRERDANGDVAVDLWTKLSVKSTQPRTALFPSRKIGCELAWLIKVEPNLAEFVGKLFLEPSGSTGCRYAERYQLLLLFVRRRAPKKELEGEDRHRGFLNHPGEIMERRHHGLAFLGELSSTYFHVRPS